MADISEIQARTLALCIYGSIRAYVNKHPHEFKDFLKSEKIGEKVGMNQKEVQCQK